MFEDPFFSLPKNSEWNATIGTQGDEVSYIDGYIEASLELAKLILAEKKYEQRDTLVLPILYNARHAIELLLKFVIRHLNKSGIISCPYVPNHDIASHYSLLVDADVPDTALNSQLGKLKPYVDSLARIDEDGQGLRYRITNTGDIGLAEYSLANIAVIALSLTNLSTLVENIKYRLFDLCDEHNTGTYTTRLSRSDLHDIVGLLPKRANWRSSEFASARDQIMNRYGIGSRQFSSALDAIQKSRELNSKLGVETEPLGLNDSKVLFLCEQWFLLHPKRTETSELGLDYFNRDNIDEIIQNLETEHEVVQRVSDNITLNELADAQAIFYLARNGEYSEYYEESFKLKASILNGESSLTESTSHLMSKTNFLKEMIKGLKMVGKIQLSIQLEELVENAPMV